MKREECSVNASPGVVLTPLPAIRFPLDRIRSSSGRLVSTHCILVHNVCFSSIRVVSLDLVQQPHSNSLVDPTCKKAAVPE